MYMNSFRIAALILAVLLTGCSKAPQADPNEAVRKALMQYLAQRQNLSMDKMDVEFTKLTVTGNTADAEVMFKVKGTSQGMSIRYTLQRSGETWTVDKGSSTAPNHPSPGQSAEPPAPATGGMPAGHPPIATETPAAPKKK